MAMLDQDTQDMWRARGTDLLLSLTIKTKGLLTSLFAKKVIDASQLADFKVRLASQSLSLVL
jgi:hypothetical protein